MSGFDKVHKNGMKVVNNNTWNDLYDTLDNVNIGSGSFDNPMTPGKGIQLNTDSFFTSHVAEIRPSLAEAIIGTQRTEDYYPYVDNLGITSFYEDIYLVQNGANWVIDDADKFSEGRTVVFLTENIIVPFKPIDKSNGSIVGYQWVLTANVIDMDFSGGTIYVRLEWAPESVFEDDVQASLYTAEYDKTDPESWGPSSTASDTLITLEEIINDNMASYPSVPYTSITLANDSILEQFTISIPIARYDWNFDQDQLERCVQLPILIPSGGGSSTIVSNGTQLIHPFRARAVGSPIYYYVVGLERDQLYYAPKDLITIYDMDESKAYIIDKTVPEYVNTVTGDQIVYYRIYRDETGTQPWNADLQYATLLNYELLVKTDTEAIFVPIFHALTGGGVGQLQFSDINVWVRPHQPSFSAFTYDGGVVISDGQVNISKDHTTTVAGVTASGLQDAWVEITSSPNVTPVVNPTIQIGTYLGYEDETAGVLTRRILLGEWGVDGEWVPKHLGDINLGTVYQPNIPTEAQYLDAQGYVVPAGNGTTVGATKDLFFDGALLGIDVIGGDYEKVTDLGTLQLGGTSDDVAQAIVTGVSKTGDTQLTFTTGTHTVDTERGLVQTNTSAAGANVVIDFVITPTGSLVEGLGIDITEAPVGTFTITSLLVDDNTGVDVTLGAAGAAHTLSLDYPTIWSHLLAGTNITLNKVGDDVTINATVPVQDVVEGAGIDVTEAPAGTFTVTSLLVDDNTGVDVTQGLAGAAHTLSLNYPTIWGHLLAGTNITLDKVGDDVTINATGFTNTDINVKVSAADTATGYLGAKITAGDGLTETILNPAANESLELKVNAKNSIEIDAGSLQLDGDVLAPGNFYQYGSNSIGDKGYYLPSTWWHSSDSNILYSDGDGFYYELRIPSNSSLSIGGALGPVADYGVSLINDLAAPSDFSVYGYRYASDEKNWNTIDLFFKDGNTTSVNAPGSLAGNECYFEVTTQLSVDSDTAGVKLVNDAASPGNNYFYGTGATGTKGFNGLTQQEVVVDVALSATGVLTKTTKLVWIWNPATAVGPTSAGSLTTTTCP